MAKKAITPEALKDAETRGWEDWWLGAKMEPPKSLKGELADAWHEGFKKADEKCGETAVIYKQLLAQGFYMSIAQLDELSIEKRQSIARYLRNTELDTLEWLLIEDKSRQVEGLEEGTEALHIEVAKAEEAEADNHGFEEPSPLRANEYDDNSHGDDDVEKTVTQSPVNSVALDKPVELPVDFGGVSFNAETVSIGLTIQRGVLTVADAADIFVGNSIEGEVALTIGDADSKQKSFPSMEDANPHIPGPFISSGLSVKKKYFAVRLRISVSKDSKGLMELTKFSKRRGTLVIKNYRPHTKDEEHDSDENVPSRDPDIIHEDVEAGKHRPHGHPAMEALAQVQRETLPFPAPPPQKPREDEKLELCDDQLLASLKSVAVPVIPADVLREWSPELRDEIDTWAKQVLQAMSGALDVELPDIPDELLFYLADEQKNDPVQFALQQVGHEVAQLSYYCFECQKHRPMEPEDDGYCRTDGCTYGAVCTLCGFYGDPNVDSAGIYVESNEFYLPTPSIVCADGSGLTIRVAQGADGKHRPSSILHADLEGVDHLFPEATEAPSIRHPGFATEKQAVVGEAERLSALLQSIDGEDAKQLFKDLQAFILRVKIDGESPREISDATISDDDAIAGKVGE